MRVLLLGDASNYHRALAEALAERGHHVTVASNGSHWMGTRRDIDISRRPGKLGGAVLWARLNTVLRSTLTGYDVVHIHNPFFLDLQPERIRQVFGRIKRGNGAVFLTALGTDPQYVEMCLSDDCPLRYSEYRVGDTPTPYALSHADRTAAWLSPRLRDHSRYIYDNIDGAVSALYEYHLSIARHLPSDRIQYAGIPIGSDSLASASPMSCTPHPRLAGSSAELPSGPLHGFAKASPPTVLVACHRGREAEKGVDRMLPVLRQLKDEGRLRLDMVQDLPFELFKLRLDAADIVVDQLYSYTPATSALMAMARGKIVVSGAEPEYYDFIGENTLRPIINADPANLDRLYADLRALCASTDAPGCDPAIFVAKHNAADVVAQRLEALWTRCCK